MTTLRDPLRETIERRLSQRWDTAQITVLARARPPLDLTGRDLHAAAAQLVERWGAQFGPGPHTLVLALPPGERFLAALLAGLLGGHTLVPVALPRAGAHSDRLAHVLGDCDATALLCLAEHRPAILRHLGTAEDRPAGPRVVAIDGPDNTEADGVAPRRGADAGPGPAIIQYTSGSMRLPKGVRIFGEQILANADLVMRSWDLDASSRFVNWLPHYHDMGLMGGILYPLLAGAYSVQMSPLDMIRRPADWLRAVSTYRATFSGGPAFAFADCVRRVADEDCVGLDLSCWSRAFCGAEPIPAGLLPSFRSRFAPYGLAPAAVFGCYGLAEMTLFAAGAPEDGPLPLPPKGCGAVHPCRLTEITAPGLRIVDPESGRSVPDGESGEIWLRGDSMGRGYLNRPKETQTAFGVAPASGAGGEWLRTGDLGAISGEWVYVTGRLKDILIVNGRKVAAAELEWLAAGLDDALNPLAAAAFMPDPTESGTAVLLIELKSGRKAPDRPDTVRVAIERAVSGEWGLRLRDVRILPRGGLERTTSGKIRRQAVAEAYRQGRYATDGEATGAAAP
ncbi:acyl-CoA synthetase (AMP-forming)/AMP-acid ligase II [Methylorubrum rhodinum]|uniref:Acyl-CoA synthetase (AMP-forming)/AMP-acid ligase II n=1 Tax=Methylorubrum rhodinum TaxID=29428 RepID=A0A840ZLY5_9HYPH|nr:AMP-binding protein [Methylorubrum rhodinum]MBB5758194.1 acyl-CoA synthetase (AMP-forming)/AMP-acid ligase II [Methylorubrum rhodinum]